MKVHPRQSAPWGQRIIRRMHMHRALIIAAMKRNDVARAAGAALVFLAAAAAPVAGALAATARAPMAET
jgi:hypothetical protein